MPKPVEIEILMRDRLTSAMKRGQQATRDLRGEAAAVNRELQDTERVTNALSGAIGKIASAFAAKELVQKITTVRGEFQQLEVAFTTMLQSGEKAKALMQQLTQTAATTPFGLTEVAQGAKQLLAYGFEVEKVNGTLIQLGDIAAGLSIPLGDLVYLYGTTMAQGRLYTQDLNQFTNRGIPMIAELAKQFGVAESQVKKLVEEGKVGFPEVQKVIESLTGEGGKFGGLMAEQAKTITGQISNIEDAISVMFNKIGQQNEGLISGVLSGVSSLVENYERTGEILLTLAGIYGTYRVAVMAAAAAEGWATVSEAAHYQALLQTEKAQKLLNATMLNNPYVLTAVAVASLTAAIYNIVTATSEYEEAQERLDKQTKENEASVVKELTQLEALNRQLQECEEGSDGYKTAKQAIIDQYGQYYSGLDKEIEKVGNLSGVYDQLTEAIRKSIGARNLKSFYDQEMDNYDKIVSEKLDQAYTTLQDKYGKGEGSRLYHEFFKAVNNSQYKINPQDFEKLGNATFWDTRWGSQASDGIVDFKISVARLIREIGQAKDASDKVLTEYKDKYEITDEQWNEILGGGTKTEKQDPTKPELTDKEKKAREKAEKERKDQQAKEVEQRLKHADEIRQLKRETSDAQTAASLAAIRDDAERERAEREAQHKKTIADIEAQRDDIYKSIYEQRKQAYETANKGDHYENTDAGKAGWQGVKGTLTEDETAYYNQREAIITAELEKENAVWARYVESKYKSELQAMRDYLKEYGTLYERRQAITEEYAEKISKAEASGNIGDVMRLKAEKEAKMSALALDDLKQSIDWETIFGNLDRISTESLNTLKEKLRTVLGSGDILPEDAKVLVEKILEIEDKISEKSNIWSSLIPALKERERITREVAQLEENSAIAAEKLYTAKADQTATTIKVQSDLGNLLGRDIMPDDLKGSKEDIIKRLGIDKASPKFNEVSKALDTLTEATQRTTHAEEALANAKKLEDTKKEILNGFKGKGVAAGIGDIFSNAVSMAGGGALGIGKLIQTNANSMAELTDKIGLGQTEFGEAVHGFADSVNGFMGAVQSLASGDVFGAVSGIIDGIGGFGEMFGINWSGGNEAEYAKAMEELTQKNADLIVALDSLREELANSAGALAIDAYNKATAAQQQINDNTLRMVTEQMGYHSAHHSWGSYWNDRGGFSQEELAYIRQQRTELASWSGNVWTMTPEEAKALVSIAEVRDIIRNTGKGPYGESVLEQMDEYAKLAGEMQSLKDQLYETLTTTTKEDVFSGFLDSLYDLASGSETVFEDIADNWQTMQNKMVINNLVGARFQKQLEQWYNSLGELNEQKAKGYISDTNYAARLNTLKSQYEDYVRQAQNDIELLREQGIIMSSEDDELSSNSSKRSSNSGGFSSMTYEQGSKLEGMFTNGLIVWRSIDGKMTDVATQMSRAGDTLARIENNTGQTAMTLKEIKSEIEAMKRDGIKVK